MNLVQYDHKKLNANIICDHIKQRPLYLKRTPYLSDILGMKAILLAFTEVLVFSFINNK
jgi:hypothetical protein